MNFFDSFAGKRVFVTGHTGFKGAWLSAWLKHLGAEVRGYSIGIPTEPSLFELAGMAGDVDHVLGDIRDAARLSEALLSWQPDIVFHLAAQPIVSRSYADPLETISTNVMGAANVLEALRKLQRPCAAVIVATDKCYENVEWVWGYRETDRLGGKDIYSASKAGAEVIFHAYVRSFFAGADTQVRLASARAGNVIGGGDWAEDRLVPDAVRAWQRGERVSIRSPNATRPWQHVLEPLSGYLALAASLAASPARHGQSYNFGPRSEQNRTVLQVLRDLGAIWGHASPDAAIDLAGVSDFREAHLLKLNCDKALIELNWEPSLSYRQCVHLTGEWYRRVVRDGELARTVTEEHLGFYLNAMRGAAGGEAG